jgi:hypothetical protein
MAANLVSNTNIIKNNKVGFKSYLAQFINISSNLFPVVGSAIKLIG